MPKSILIINPFGVGDVLFSTPLISALKKTFSGSNIAYICNIRTREILETNPEVNEIFVFERDEYRALYKKSKIEYFGKFFNFWQDIKRRKFDMVIDLSLGREYAFLCWLVGIKERRGFDYRGRGRFLTHKLQFNGFNDKPVTEYYLDLIDYKPSGDGLNTVLIPRDKDKEYIDDFLKKAGVTGEDFLIGIAPGGGISFGKKDMEKRRWGAIKFGELADRLIGKFNTKIVLIWGPGEESLVKEIAGKMQKGALVAPKTSIREMAALCKRCNVVICSEGGPLHIASSQSIGTVSIFGPVDEKVYGPYPPAGRNVVISTNRECRPCYKRFKFPDCNTRLCLDDISVGAVFDAIIKDFKLKV